MRSFNLTILALLSISTSINGQFSKVVKSVALPVTIPPIASSFISIVTADGNNTILGVQEPSDSSSVNSILPQNLISAVVVGKKMEGELYFDEVHG